MIVGNQIRHAGALGLVSFLMIASGCTHKYENNITKDTQQPDKVLFDSAVDDIEHGRFERARLTLQTMMNTYDTSEYLAKAKLAVADSWKREGGAHNMAQAEAEYKDFILFYPNMEESAEAQYKVCDMQYQQLEKADRDPIHARLTEVECKNVLEKWPNSKYATDAASRTREAQEALADGEYRVGVFYAKRGGNGYFASANRMNTLVDQYPLYSQADEALWVAADDYNQMGDRFENQQAEMYTRIVRDYPLSLHTEDAKAQLRAMGRPVPEADPVAEARMKFELDNRAKRSLLSKFWGPFSSRPNTAFAAKSGTPEMESFHPNIPMDVPDTAKGIETTNTVTIGPVNRDILDKAPDARTTASGTAPGATPATPATAASGDASADKPGTDASSTSAAISAPAPAPAAAAGNKKVKPPKPPKAVALKKRPRPSEKKSTAAPPAQATPSAQATPPAGAPEQPAAKTAAGGGPGAPEALKQ